ncbi:hypothetical protein K9M78_07075 [Candidatus Bipolaricaulota bacterium]|nr:hypothetical protein [Candidatus Bipolaricaulota bacterium]
MKGFCHAWRTPRDEYDIENGFMQGIGAVDKVKLGNYRAKTAACCRNNFSVKSY